MLIDERFYRNHPDWRVEEADHGVVYPGVFFRHGYYATNEVISEAKMQCQFFNFGNFNYNIENKQFTSLSTLHFLTLFSLLHGY